MIHFEKSNKGETFKNYGRWPVWLYQPMVNSLKLTCHMLSNDPLLWNINLVIIKIILKNIYCAQEAFCWLLQCNFCLLIAFSSEVTRAKSWLEDIINIKFVLQSYGDVSYNIQEIIAMLFEHFQASSYLNFPVSWDIHYMVSIPSISIFSYLWIEAC